ncbi:LysR substrate-binding domain-containing protein [Herbaspirillum autotrophicum]|uniref:LysR substrate-binding domain-containing protein n=1 Tax=Herbaspirillum autotrophicum TaxID=180195 RepID=UPI00067A943C|nr:LysR substrate-binding domain-containing protein [Herbaspirillum autotrophicum]
MDFRHIDAFRAVMLTRSSTKAAQLLGTSQPGISRLIADLERTTQLTLFSRERGRLEPTETAVELFGEVQRRYAGLDNIREFALSLRNPDEAIIRAGSVMSFGLGYFARAIAEFHKTHPSIRVALTTGFSTEIRDHVVARTLDLGIVTDQVDLSETDAISIAKLPALCALPAQHPLARKSVIHALDLHGCNFISYEAADMIRWGVDDLFREAGVTPQVTASVRYSVNICTLVREQVGVGLVHPVAAYDFLESDGIVFRRFEPAMTFHSIRIKPRTPAASAQTEALLDALDRTLVKTIADVEAHL